MFQEFTLVDPETQCEVMVHINSESGKIDGLYCYAKHLPVIENFETGHIYKIKTKSGKNPLFVHIQNKSKIYGLLLNNGFIFCLDEEDSDYNNDTNLIQKSLSVNNIGYMDNIY